jgi:uncharacterized protein (DUF302 family)
MYGFTIDMPGVFETVVEDVIEELKQEGFGVLTEIDVAATLKAKLGEDMAPYVILGACNPALAHKALKAEPDIGLLLPCNVIVRESEKGTICVGFMYPVAVLGMVDSNTVKTLAIEATNRLVRVKNALQDKAAA